MSNSKKLIVVHGEKGGVGKSLLSALCVDYLIRQGLTDHALLVEGDAGIPDVGERYRDTITTLAVPLQRADVVEEAVGELFQVLEQQYAEGARTVVINTPAGAASTIDSLAVDLIHPVLDALGVALSVAVAIGPGAESPRLVESSLSAGLCGIADRRIAVPNLGLAALERMAWSTNPVREQWLESGGQEIALPALAARVSQRLHELPGPLHQLTGPESPLPVVDRMLVKRWIDASDRIPAALLSDDAEVVDLREARDG